MNSIRVSIIVVFIVAISALVVGILALAKSSEKFEVVGETSDAEFTTSPFTDLLEDNKTLITKLVRDELANPDADQMYIPSLKTDSISTSNINEMNSGETLVVHSKIQAGNIAASGEIKSNSLNSNYITANPLGGTHTGLTIGPVGGGVGLATGSNGVITTPNLHVNGAKDGAIVVNGNPLGWISRDGLYGCMAHTTNENPTLC